MAPLAGGLLEYQGSLEYNVVLAEVCQIHTAGGDLTEAGYEYCRSNKLPDHVRDMAVSLAQTGAGMWGDNVSFFRVISDPISFSKEGAFCDDNTDVGRSRHIVLIEVM